MCVEEGPSSDAQGLLLYLHLGMTLVVLKGTIWDAGDQTQALYRTLWAVLSLTISLAPPLNSGLGLCPQENSVPPFAPRGLKDTFYLSQGQDPEPSLPSSVMHPGVLGSGRGS